MSSIVLFDIASLAILLIILFYLYNNPEMKMVYNGYFKIILLSTVFGVVLEIISYTNKYNIVKIDDIYMRWVLVAYFYTYSLIALIFAVYNLTFFGIHNSMRRIYKVFFVLPAIIGLLIAILTPFKGYIFVIENNLYERGKLFFVYLLVPLFYLIVSLFSIYKNCEMQPERVVDMLRKALLVIWTISIFYIIVPDVISVFPCITIGIFMMILCAANYNTHVNWKIQMFRKKSFNGSLKIYSKNKKGFTVYVIKVLESSFHKKIYGDEYYEKMLFEVGIFLRKTFNKCRPYQLDDNSFGIIVPDFSRIEEEKVISQIREKFGKRWKWENVETRLMARVGIIKYPLDTDEIEDIYDGIHALCNNETMKRGVEVVRIYEDSFNKYARAIEVERIVGKALNEGMFEVYYQPIYSVYENKIISAEALLRLKDPILGFISPDEFIEVAERNGSIIEIGEYVFEEVCKFISAGNLSRLGLKYIEINLSPIQTMQYRLSERFLEIMKKHNVKSHEINLEITESQAAFVSENLLKNIKHLSANGITFSLDDYGTGYSNMSTVISLTFSFIKIDKTIVWDSFRDEKADEILKCMVGLFKKLGVKVVAEGVETKEMVDKLKNLECDYLQGYFYSKPLPKSEFIDYIMNVKY